MKVTLLKEDKRYITLAEAPIVREIINDMKEDECTAADYAEYAIQAAYNHEAYGIEVLKASAKIAKNAKKSEILAEKINELNYGDVLTHEQIASLIEEDYPSNKYTSTIAKTKKLLLKKYNKTIENIVGDGYRVVDPDNFVNQSLKHYKRGFNEMQKGYDTLEYAPTKDMTKEGRDTYRRVHDRAITLAAAMKGASVELKTLGQKKHPMALENIKN